MNLLPFLYFLYTFSPSPAPEPQDTEWGFQGAEVLPSTADSTSWDKVLLSFQKALEREGGMAPKVRRGSQEWVTPELHP